MWYKLNVGMTEKQELGIGAYVAMCRYRVKMRERGAYLHYKYGVSLAEMDELYVAQNGLCAICGRPMPKKDACIDHDHETDVIRGLVHGHCNSVIGFAHDDIEILAGAISYLTRNRDSGSDNSFAELEETNE